MLLSVFDYCDGYSFLSAIRNSFKRSAFVQPEFGRTRLWRNNYRFELKLIIKESLSGSCLEI